MITKFKLGRTVNTISFKGAICIISLLFIASADLSSQAPETFSYQAVVRDADNNLIQNEEIAIQISLLQGSESGVEVYVETHLITSNDNGLVTLEVGGGSAVSGSFSELNWADGPYFLRTEVDVEGGSNYMLSGTQQLLSVPYALYAAESGSDQDFPGGNEVGEMLFWDGDEWQLVETGNHSELLYFCNGIPTWGGCAPLVQTNSVEDITAINAVVQSTVTHDGGATVTGRGVVWSTEPMPTLEDNFTEDGEGTGLFESNISGLDGNTTYYLRSYANNINGTQYGNQLEFTTQELMVTDIDGNTYETVVIGNQEWMAENLKTTRFSNGDTIPLVLDNSEWLETTSSSAYSYYDNDSMYIEDYGFLYNWYAARNSRGVCPEGWRIPTDSDWNVLINYLGGSDEAGGKMKTTGVIEVGTGVWQDPNEGATNESGFSALPGGHRVNGGQYEWIRRTATFWAHTELNDATAWTRRLSYNNSDAIRANLSKRMGFSVRCMRD